MNALVPLPLEGELLPPGHGLVRVVGDRSVFASDRVTLDVAAGASIADILAEAFPDRRGRPLAVYLVGASGEAFLPEHLWPRVRPKPGTTVSFKALSHGRTLALAAVAVAAIAAAVFAPYLLPAGFTLFGLTAAATGTLVSAVAGAAVTLGGQLAVNALFPVRPPRIAPQLDNLSQARRTVYSIAGAANQARQFGSIPVVLGRHRIYPPFGAVPYTELVGDDIFLILLYIVGYGPLDLTEFKIGETPLAQYNVVQTEIRNGYPDDDPITLYPFDVHEEPVNIPLAGGVVHQFFTEPNTDRFSVDITAPNGIFKVNSNGSRSEWLVQVRIQYAPAAGGPTVNLGTIDFALNPQTTRVGTTVNVPRGQYIVYVAKETADANLTNVSDAVAWTALRSFRFEPPVSFDAPLAMVALRIKASGQLNGVISDFNCIATSRVKSWNGAAWVDDTPSRRPADLYRHALQGAANKGAVADAALDLVNLEEWAADNDANGFTFDTVIESPRSVYAMLADIAAAGRAKPVRPDGRWGVVWDRFDAPIAQHFSPRNSWGFQGQRRFRRLPHAFRVRFKNADKGYALDERPVYADGYDETNATIFEAIEFEGRTGAESVWVDGRYQFGQLVLRPEEYQLTTNWQHLRCNQGDRVRVMSDVAGWGQISARIIAVDGALVYVDEIVTMLPGKSYVARFRLANGDTLLRMVIVSIGEHSSFVLDDAGDAGAGNPTTKPAARDLMVGFGEAGDDLESVVLRVKSITHQNDLCATLVFEDDAPALADVASGPIPPFNSHISAPVDPFALPPQNLAVTEIIDGAGAAKTVRARLSWQAQRFATVAYFEAQTRNDAMGLDWDVVQKVPAPQTYADFPDLLLGARSFRVRTIFIDGDPSDWATLLASQITGVHLNSPLPDVQDLHAIYRDNVLCLDWKEVSDYRAPFYEIRKGDSFESALRIEPGIVAHPPFASLGAGTYWVTAIASPIAGLTVRSANPQSILLEGAQLTKNVVAQFDQAALSWPGIFGGTVAESGALIRTGGAGNILTDPDILNNPDLLNFGGGGDGTYAIPAVEIIDLGRAVDVGIGIDLVAGGARSDQNILSDPDFLNNPDILDISASRFVEVYGQIRVATNDPTDVYSLDDVYSADVADVYGNVWNWSPWERWSSGRKLARAVDSRLILNTLDPTVYAYAQQYILTIDMPDRVDHYPFTTDAVDGDDIVFTPDLAIPAAPFNGGPNASPTPSVTGAIRAPSDGDRLRITGITAAGCHVETVDAGGTRTARLVDIFAQGF